jgi:hypothetical protein
MSLIHIENLSKQFKILNRREGLGGAFRVAFYPSQLFLRRQQASLLIYFFRSSALDSSPSLAGSGPKA